MKNLLKRIEWPNCLFVTLTPLTALVGTMWIFVQGGPHPATWVLFGVMLWVTGLGITAGYHRLFSHKTYRASWIVRLVLLLFGGAAFEGSAREWCCAHRKHHRHVDHAGDPYNITKGFWYAHIGWVIMKADQSDESNIPDLNKDPLVSFQDRFYIPLAILVSFVLPAAIAAFWGDVWGGLIIAGVTRVVVNHHLTFFINSYCHCFGKQNYSDHNTSRDSGFIAFFTYGEGYHNFHHAFPGDYRNGVRAYDFDPAKWLIQCLAWFGLARSLRRVPQQRILEAKLQMDEKRVRARAERYEQFAEEWDAVLMKTRSNVRQLHARFVELKLEYRKLKRSKMHTMQDRLKAMRREIQQTKKDFRVAMAQWRLLIKGASAV